MFRPGHAGDSLGRRHQSLGGGTDLRASVGAKLHVFFSMKKMEQVTMLKPNGFKMEKSEWLNLADVLR